MSDGWRRVAEARTMLRMEPRARPDAVIFFGPEDLSVLDGASLVAALLDDGDPRRGGAVLQFRKSPRRRDG